MMNKQTPFEWHISISAIQVLGIVLILGVLCGSTGCSGGAPKDVATTTGPITIPPSSDGPAVARRGFPSLAPWASCYGSAAQMGDLDKAAQTFRIINIDADPGVGEFTPA